MYWCGFVCIECWVFILYMSIGVCVGMDVCCYEWDCIYVLNV